MKLGAQLLSLLDKKYEPSSTVETVFNRFDILLKTDELGRPVMAFIGTKQENGQIKGERFVRRLLADQDGNIVKDHWDNKGRT